MILPDFNIAKFNVPISVKKAFDKGKIADSYRQMYVVADELASIEAGRRQTQKTAEYFDSKYGSAEDATQPSMIMVQSRIIDYKNKRVDYHMKNMMHLLELYAESHQEGNRSH
jgi:hypothetical protein